MGTKSLENREYAAPAKTRHPFDSDGTFGRSTVARRTTSVGSAVLLVASVFWAILAVGLNIGIDLAFFLTAAVSLGVMLLSATRGSFE